jgi:hypothetical protein
MTNKSSQCSFNTICIVKHLLKFHGKKLINPIRDSYRVCEESIAWRNNEVLYGDFRECY